jgi:hypothetical protein
MPTKEFKPVSVAQIQQFRATLLANNVILPAGNQGEIKDTTHNIVFDFDYNGTDTLKLTIASKPWWMPESSVWSAIQEHLAV